MNCLRLNNQVFLLEGILLKQAIHQVRTNHALQTDARSHWQRHGRFVSTMYLQKLLVASIFFSFCEHKNNVFCSRTILCISNEAQNCQTFWIKCTGKELKKEQTGYNTPTGLLGMYVNIKKARGKISNGVKKKLYLHISKRKQRKSHATTINGSNMRQTQMSRIGA